MQDLFSQSKYTPKNISVLQLIREYESKHKDIFENVKSFWNQNIREFHRDMTGLKLERRSLTMNKGTTVSIRFLPDGDDKFIRLIDEHYPDLDFLEYSKLKDLHDTLLGAAPYLEGSSQRTEFNGLLKYCNEYFTTYNFATMLERLFKSMGSSKDLWGIYSLGDSRIEIYYVPLIIFCRIVRIRLEHAIVVVLTHELAHAYHDVGLDADGSTWKSMKSADIRIIEGLAQYFTYLFVSENELLYPGVKDAYERMLSCQSGAYVVHVPWIKNYKKEHVKNAFNVTRRTSVTSFSIFEGLLEKAKEQLK